MNMGIAVKLSTVMAVVIVALFLVVTGIFNTRKINELLQLSKNALFKGASKTYQAIVNYPQTWKSCTNAMASIGTGFALAAKSVVNFCRHPITGWKAMWQPNPFVKLKRFGAVLLLATAYPSAFLNGYAMGKAAAAPSARSWIDFLLQIPDAITYWLALITGAINSISANIIACNAMFMQAYPGRSILETESQRVEFLLTQAGNASNGNNPKQCAKLLTSAATLLIMNADLFRQNPVLQTQLTNKLKSSYEKVQANLSQKQKTKLKTKLKKVEKSLAIDDENTVPVTTMPVSTNSTNPPSTDASLTFSLLNNVSVALKNTNNTQVLTTTLNSLIKATDRIKLDSKLLIDEKKAALYQAKLMDIQQQLVTLETKQSLQVEEKTYTSFQSLSTPQSSFSDAHSAIQSALDSLKPKQTNSSQTTPTVASVKKLSFWQQVVKIAATGEAPNEYIPHYCRKM